MVKKPWFRFLKKRKVATLATKAELKDEQNEIIKVEAFNSGYFCGKSHFKDDGTQNHSEIIAIPLCLGSISKDVSVDNMKRIGLNGYVYGFSVDDLLKNDCSNAEF